MTEKVLKGVPVSKGIVLGHVLIIKDNDVDITKQIVNNSHLELEKLHNAINSSVKELKAIREKALREMGEDEALIFDAHITILNDIELISKVEEYIKIESVNADYAYKKVTDEFIELFNSMDNDYLRERAADIKDIRQRVINNILGIKNIELSSIEEEVILVAKDLTPSHTASMNRNKVIGFITEEGGVTSHTSIMARTLEVPAVVGVKDLLKTINAEDKVTFDGEVGTIYINPKDETIGLMNQSKEKYIKQRKRVESVRGKKSVTLDNHVIEISGNIGSVSDVKGVNDNDGDGVGLFRSEFLYMDRDRLPTEEEQFIAYRDTAIRLEGKPLVIRTLDVGGDKEIEYLELDKEMNPFLGYRAIRVCLERKDMFKEQIRALLRASDFGNIKIMFPMISSLQELMKAKGVVDECMKELDEKGIKYNKDIEVGMMIEVPSAAIISDILAKEVDFFSIGTNDLIQYTTAVDRMNTKIKNLYTPYHPSILRLVDMVINNGHKEGIWVGMCGEVAGNPKLIPVLLGMGLDEFSMSASNILEAKYILRNISKKDMEKHIDDILQLQDSDSVERYIEENIAIPQ